MGLFIATLYDLSDSVAISNGTGGIQTDAQHYSGHIAFSDLINRSLKLIQLASTTFRMSLDTSCPAGLVVPSSDHYPIRNRQPHSVLTANIHIGQAVSRLVKISGPGTSGNDAGGIGTADRLLGHFWSSSESLVSGAIWNGVDAIENGARFLFIFGARREA
ncbi:hypothetical protein AMTR_s00023p00247450 [Amborella trichopoda]|uniref:Uncharacterized protein n=1 Tax=Amborella trichopoda TaxID=13333 RepID=W1NKK9_AMBTC|nr:hypothetical protein AMTR_s00023p00247450 [Amborella trichopoda]